MNFQINNDMQLESEPMDNTPIFLKNPSQVNINKRTFSNQTANTNMNIIPQSLKHFDQQKRRTTYQVSKTIELPSAPKRPKVFETVNDDERNGIKKRGSLLKPSIDNCGHIIRRSICGSPEILEQTLFNSKNKE